MKKILNPLPRVACITMVHDDVEFLDIWTKYYSRIFGTENCYVIDHVSKDRTGIERAAAVGVQILKIPFEYPADAKNGIKDNGNQILFDPFRFSFIGKLRTALLVFYDVVIFHDVDELLFVRPGEYEDISQYVRENINRIKEQEIVAGVGVEIFHAPAAEGKFDPTCNVFDQRRNASFRVPQCKPTVFAADIMSRPHAAARPFGIDADLCLLHLKFLDRDILIERQKRRFAAVQRSEVPDWTRWGWDPSEIDAKLKEFTDLPLEPYTGLFEAFLAKHFTVSEQGYYLVDKIGKRGVKMYTPAAGIPGSELRRIEGCRFELPPSFKKVGI